MSTVIILGAKGRFGRAAVSAFSQAGWSVRAFGRNWTTPKSGPVAYIEGDARDAAALIKACAGCDVIVNALNPVYENWVEELPQLTSAVIAAAKATDALVVIPGNVYNYGAGAPEMLTETTPWRPTSRKGALRVEMENAYRDAQVRTLVVRAGDFIDRDKLNNWFNVFITDKLGKGVFQYPAALTHVHAWAYIPDVVRAMVGLVENRAEFATFEEFGVEGHSMTGATLRRHVADHVGKPLKVKGMPWRIIGLMGLFKAHMRELHEMRYLWSVPHRIDGSKLQRVLPDFRPSPIADVIRDALTPV